MYYFDPKTWNPEVEVYDTKKGEKGGTVIFYPDYKSRLILTSRIPSPINFSPVQPLVTYLIFTS